MEAYQELVTIFKNKRDEVSIQAVASEIRVKFKCKLASELH
jgi:hypothetical protein